MNESLEYYFSILDIEPTNDIDLIKDAYLKKINNLHVESIEDIPEVNDWEEVRKLLIELDIVYKKLSNQGNLDELFFVSKIAIIFSKSETYSKPMFIDYLKSNNFNSREIKKSSILFYKIRSYADNFVDKTPNQKEEYKLNAETISHKTNNRPINKLLELNLLKYLAMIVVYGWYMNMEDVEINTSKSEEILFS